MAKEELLDTDGKMRPTEASQKLTLDTVSGKGKNTLFCHLLEIL